LKKTFKILKFLCLLPFFIFTNSIKAQDFKKDFNQATEYINQDLFDYAVPILERLVASDTTNANTRFLLGFSYYEQGVDRLKAKPHLEYALNFIKKNYKADNFKERGAPAETRFYLANIYHINYQFEKALELYQIIEKESGSKKNNEVFAKEIKRQIEMNQTAIKLFGRPVKVLIENMGDSINTEFPEYSPVLSVDESVLIFTTRRPETKGGMRAEDQKFFEDIYIAEKLKDSRGWTKAKPISDNINTDNHEATVGLSADGEILYIYKGNITGDLYESQLDGLEWTELKKLDDNITTFATRETHAVISADKQFIFFASNRPGGYGGLDLWVCKKLPNGNWALPQNLGPTINTPLNEDSPFIHPDGKQLIFSSTGHAGMGGYDIFTSEFDIDKNEWSIPENMGYPINTTDDDIFFNITIDGGRGYFSSRRAGGRGDQDIYKVTFEEPTDKYLTLYIGYIVNENGERLPLGLQVNVTNTMNDMTYIYRPNKVTGKYVIILNPGDYHLEYLLNDEKFHEEDIFVSVDNAYNIMRKEVMLDLLVLEGIRRRKELEEKAKKEGLTVEEIERRELAEIVKMEREFENYKKGEQLGQLKEIIFTTNEDKPKTEQEIFNEIIDKISLNKFDGVEYYVQVGAYRNTSEVNFDNIADLGVIKRERATDDITRFLIDIPFDNMNDANILRNEAVRKGIDDAWVTIYYNGVRINSRKLYEILENQFNTELTAVSTNPIDNKPKGISFQKFFDYNAKEIDVKEKEFIEFVNKVKQLVEKKGKIEIDIESSASKVPTQTFENNYVLVEKRAEDSKLILFKELEKYGIGKDKIKLTSTNSVVQGPKYQQDAQQNMDIYKKYQYVKIVVK
jgi:tetratricopeptide (TPR) repeat protein